MASIEGLGPYSRDCLELFDTVEISGEASRAIASAPDRKFTAVEGVSLMGEDVFAGIKKREVSQRVIARVAKELYFLDKLLEKFPQHTASAPLFTYAVRVGDEPEGILTEDFTRSGTRILTEMYDHFGNPVKRDRLPEGLYRDIFDSLDGRVYPEAFGHMLGFAFDREVLVDFDDVAYPPDDEIAKYIDLVDGMTLAVPATIWQ